MSKRIVIRRGREVAPTKGAVHPDTPTDLGPLSKLSALPVGYRLMHGRTIYLKAGEEAIVEVMAYPVNMNARLSNPTYYLPLRGDTLVLAL